MKTIRDDKDKAAVARIQVRCMKFNPNIEKALSSFLFRFLAGLEQVLSNDQWSELAAQLTSDRVKRKRKLERLKELLEKADDSEIQKFEAKIERRHGASSSVLSQNTAENS